MKYLKISLVVTIALTYFSVVSCKNASVESNVTKLKDSIAIKTSADSVISVENIIIVDTFETGEPMKIHIPDTADNGTLYEKQFYKSGILFIEGSLKNDKRTGKWLAYYESGQLWSLGYFEDGLKSGSSEVYYENGKIRYTKTYVKDVAEGLWKFYSEDGKQIGEVVYENGKILSQKGTTKE